MTDYISKETFDQFEKRIDDKLDNIALEINALPDASDIKVLLLENNEKYQNERKLDRNMIIGWMIGFVGLGFTVIKALGWL